MDDNVQTEPVDAAQPTAGERFPVVAIGASAGGLAAFTRLLAKVPADSGMAFVLLQHLAPDHESLLATLLGRDCALPVVEAAQGVAVRPGRVYVIAPNTELTILAGVLQVGPRNPGRTRHLPIDAFFRSLAAERRELAVGVVLSGDGSDGTLGLAEIRAAGGLTFAQDEHGAEHRSMPASAIAGGCVDFVLPPEEIAAELARMAPVVAASEAEPTPDAPAADLRGILDLLHQESGIDFAQYRASTLTRRIRRRQAMAGDRGLADYLARLRRDPVETAALAKDVLINVTTFFRDEAMFAALVAQVLPGLAGREQIKVWIAGCSTGQEVYSLAIELIDFLERQAHMPVVRLFATDVSEWALNRARGGWYPDGIAAEIPAERLARHFVREAGGYRISKRIRSMCVFARHDLTAETPLSKMDLITCRNVLIYLSPALQLRVLPILAYALNPGGHLVLGSAETVGRSADLFDVVDQSARIYRRKAGATPVHPPAFPARPGPQAPTPPAEPALADLQRAADRIVLARYAPPGVLINDDLDIIQFRGQASRYLEPSQGRASLNVLAMVPLALSLELRGAIAAAKAGGVPVTRPRIPLRDGATLRLVDLEVIPVRPPSAERGCQLVLFSESPPGGQAAAPVESNLTRELTTSNEYLTSLIEQNSAINDQLRYVNEEAVSSNEELRCLNEEAQTAKEELESANEEMASLNEELAHRNTELSQFSGDLGSLLDGIALPVLLVDPQLRLRRVTETAMTALGLIPQDLGRPLAAVELGFRLPQLPAMVQEVMTSRRPAGVDVQCLDGSWKTLRIQASGDGGGAMLSLFDISEIRRTQERLQDAGDFARTVIETVPDPLLVLDGDLRIAVANHAFHEAFAIARDGCLGRCLHELGDRGWDTPELHRLLARLRAGEERLEDVEVNGEFAHLGHRTMRLNARRIPTPAGGPMLLIALTDITRLKAMADDLQTMSQNLLRSNSDLDQFAAVASHDLKEPLRMVASYLQLLERRHAAQIDAKGREYIGFAVDGAKRMNQMVDAILHYSRIGRNEAAHEPVELERVLREAAANVGRAALAARAAITIGAMPRVDGNPLQLVQVFQNLLSNAIKFRAQDRPLTIAIEAVADDGRWLISVADNGIGIDAKDFARVFELFERLNPRGDYPGTGIGLATAKKIVERHGGRITIASTLGVGTTVTVALPRPA